MVNSDGVAVAQLRLLLKSRPGIVATNIVVVTTLISFMDCWIARIYLSRSGVCRVNWVLSRTDMSHI